MHVISSKFLHGFGQQTDGTLTVEIIEKRLNMTTACVSSLIYVVLLKICHHITYDSLKKGILMVRDLYGYRMRFWNDRKQLLCTKIIHDIFPVSFVVLVDPPYIMCKLFKSVFSIISKTSNEKLYIVKRPDNVRKAVFKRSFWIDVMWKKKYIAEIYEKFPCMKLSKIFGGNDSYLLEKVSTARCLTTCILVGDGKISERASSICSSQDFQINMQTIIEKREENDLISSNNIKINYI